MDSAEVGAMTGPRSITGAGIGLLATPCPDCEARPGEWSRRRWNNVNQQHEGRYEQGGRPAIRSLVRTAWWSLRLRPEGFRRNGARDAPVMGVCRASTDRSARTGCRSVTNGGEPVNRRTAPGVVGKASSTPENLVRGYACHPRAIHGWAVGVAVVRLPTCVCAGEDTQGRRERAPLF